MLREVTINSERVIVGNNGALVASKSQPGFWHSVRPWAGELTCDCHGFDNHHKCRHVIVVKAIIADAQATVAAAKTPTLAPVAPATTNHDRDTAILAGPAIDPPLFSKEQPRQAPKKLPTFEELFGVA